MKSFFVFLLLFLTAGISGMLVFLNQQPITFILTPTFGGVYYTLPPVPVGLLVVLSFFAGVFVGYIIFLARGFFR
ncbi:MAG: hypothetical protein D6699_00215 [Aquificota bacterium]|nr:MAG: hypothetical protein D6699_00215 [Aquificota bacterium]